MKEKKGTQGRGRGSKKMCGKMEKISAA